MANGQLSSSVEVENVGPISGSFKIDLISPGLYELRGSKGRGKSTVLSALSLLGGHKVSLSVNDEEVDGQVSGFGTVVPIGARKKRIGELDANVIDSSKFDLLDLVDPQGKTAATRDATRIKALAALSGLKLEAKDFYSIVGGQHAYDELGVSEPEGPVLFCQRVKDKLDAAAKQGEKLADSEEGYAAGLLEQIKDIDLSGESDPKVLAQRSEEATRNMSRLLEQIAQRQRVVSQVHEAKERLAQAKAEHQIPIEDIEKDVRIHEGELSQSHKDEQGLRDQIGELERQCMAIVQQRSGIEANLKLAQERKKLRAEHDSLVAKFEEEINQELVPEVTSEEVKQAEEEVHAAEEARDQGVRIRDAQHVQGRADEHKQKALSHRKEAKVVRENAQVVFDVLTKKMTLNHIRIKNMKGQPRLVVDHPRGKNTKLDQDDGLSDGERVMACVTELLPRLDSPGLFPIPQRTYQDLPPADREELAKYAQHNGLYLFGAQVTDGELEVVKVQ